MEPLVERDERAGSASLVRRRAGRGQQVRRTVAAAFVGSPLGAGDDDRRVGGEPEVVGCLGERVGTVGADDAVDLVGQFVRSCGDAGALREPEDGLNEVVAGQFGRGAGVVSVGGCGDGAPGRDDVDAHVRRGAGCELGVPVATSSERSFTLPGRLDGMRDEEEIREQYEFLKEELDDEDMNHEGVRQMFTYYKRALGWVLEEEYI